MKLKLETESNITILCVTEDVLAQHAAILRAGITKLFQTGKKSVLLDLVGITQLDEAVSKEILALQQLAPELESQLVVASPLQGLGQAPSRQEALKLLGSALFGLLATEAALQAKLKRLEQQKAELSEKLNSSKPGEDNVINLRKENSDLKAMVRDLERQIAQHMKNRIEPRNIPMVTDRMMTLEKTLTTILGQDGIVTVK